MFSMNSRDSCCVCDVVAVYFTKCNGFDGFACQVSWRVSMIIVDYCGNWKIKFTLLKFKIVHAMDMNSYGWIIIEFVKRR